MDFWLQVLVPVATAFIGSSGAWAYFKSQDKTKKATAKLLMGLAYDKLMSKGVRYIERGYVSKDEYEEFEKYLYSPYKDLGGNGVAERIAQEVSRLPIRSYRNYREMVNDTRRKRDIPHERTPAPSYGGRHRFEDQLEQHGL